MRRLNRPRVRIPTLEASGSGGKKAAENETLFLNHPTASFLEKRKFPDHWNNRDVRGALYAMHGRCCAFCQCKLPRNDRGDVEHFRPKKEVTEAPGHLGYWWLAYDFNNYLLSCRTCNQTCKRNHFKVEPGASHFNFPDKNQMDQEKRMLLNPAEDEVESMMKLDFSDSHLPIKPSANISQRHKSKVKETVDLFHMNMDPNLVENRRRAVRKAKDAIATNRIQELQKMASRFVPDSWTVQQYLTRHNLHNHIPTPDAELRFFLDDLIEQIDLILQLISKYPKNEKLKKALLETFWSMAILWFDPPALGRPEIKSIIEGAGLLSWVDPLYQQLSAP